ncbi:hypothetical protein O6H91_01G120300 [Diphasiastrum complanatum]|uniref:Uncharacterized protein n=1 Tax=Diphasiastrum complanatum TaxID=34168 RepID=A0ACC2EVB4_DIPCM|nr:hypothetical protein O6H91_01G120300 [Diphasiastrum complanatum]
MRMGGARHSLSRQPSPPFLPQLVSCSLFITICCSLLLLLHFYLRPGPRLEYLSDDRLQMASGIADDLKLDKLDGHTKPRMIQLANGVLMPVLGFGTAGLGEHTKNATLCALQTGYRLLDSAQAREWYNEEAVGESIRLSGIHREELFLVSKLHPRNFGYRITMQQFAKSLEDLGTSYLDLFLLHYPKCFSSICASTNNEVTWHESWKALEDLYHDKKVKAIGVSNFDLEELKELLSLAEVKPAILQRYSDPFHSDRGIQDYCLKEHIQYMGYSTLGSQWFLRGYGFNPVVLQWALKHHQVVIPRSSNPNRIKENFDSLSCELGREDLVQINALDGEVP